jgi:hypothetical protein
MTHRAIVSILAVVAFASACGGGQPEAAQPTNPASSAAPAAASAGAAPAESAAPTASAAPSASAAPAGPPGPPGPGDWDGWSHDQKMAYMKATVLPKMSALFHDFDAKRFADPKCTTCHGAGAKDGSFKMPNPELPKLNLADGMKADKKKSPKIFDFMMKQVEPQMADVLGKPAYDPKTQKGFGCFDCHTKK